MKALTLWQPWATLMALGEKKIETRCWSTFYRGPVAIHAASMKPAKFLGRSRYTPEFGEEIAAVLKIDIDAVGPAIAQMPRGVVLCIVELVTIEQAERVVIDLPQREKLFGNYEAGRYAWHTKLLEVFDPPIPAKGNRKLWEWARG